jgi:hypothetical protein
MFYTKSPKASQPWGFFLSGIKPISTAKVLTVSKSIYLLTALSNTGASYYIVTFFLPKLIN